MASAVAVLRRADDMIAIQKAARALDVIVEYITKCTMGKEQRRRPWEPSFDPLMRRCMELCVKLGKVQTVRQTLGNSSRGYCWQAQSASPKSLGGVMSHLLDVAEGAVRAACDSTAVASVADLEAAPSSEELVVSALSFVAVASAVSAESSAAVRSMLILWQSYKIVLDAIAAIPDKTALLALYLEITQRALAFCVSYSRVAELKHLCNLLRKHLGDALKDGADGPDVDAVLDMHLRTRFAQLDAASKLGLHNTMFRAVEDIRQILDRSVRRPKPQLLATYYDRLGDIFWAAREYLYHAYSLYKLYSITVSQKREVSLGERARLASRLTLAALAVPLTPPGSGNEAVELETAERDRSHGRPLAHLLGFAKTPTRASLLSELVAKGVVREVIPELSGIYELLEVEFQPLTLVASVTRLLNSVRGDADLGRYVPLVEELLVLRVVSQLTTVYRVVTLSHFQSVLPGLVMPMCDVERVIVCAAKRRLVDVKIDHLRGCLHLGSNALDSEDVRGQLTELLSRLSSVADVITSGAHASKGASLLHRAFDEARAASVAREEELRARMEDIERRKRDQERAKLLEDAARAAKAKEDARQRADEEKQRQDEERRKRAAAERMKEEEQRRIDRVIAELKAAGETVNEEHVARLDAAGRDEMLRASQQRMRRAKDSQMEKMKDEGRRLEYFTRALREAERTKVEARRTERLTEARRKFVASKEAHVAGMRRKHEEDLVKKGRLAPATKFARRFEDQFKKSLAKQRAIKDERGYWIEELRKARAKRAEDESRCAAEEKRKRTREWKLQTLKEFEDTLEGGEGGGGEVAVAEGTHVEPEGVPGGAGGGEGDEEYEEDGSETSDIDKEMAFFEEYDINEELQARGTKLVRVERGADDTTARGGPSGREAAKSRDQARSSARTRKHG